MKRLLFLFPVFLSLVSFGQTYSGKTIVAQEHFTLRGNTADTLQKDTAFQNRTQSIPTSDAVYKFVMARTANVGFVNGFGIVKVNGEYQVDSSLLATAAIVKKKIDSVAALKANVSGWTPNGIFYSNGSGVMTVNTALVYDNTNLTVGANNPGVESGFILNGDRGRIGADLNGFYFRTGSGTTGPVDASKKFHFYNKGKEYVTIGSNNDGGATHYFDILSGTRLRLDTLKGSGVRVVTASPDGTLGTTASSVGNSLLAGGSSAEGTMPISNGDGTATWKFNNTFLKNVGPYYPLIVDLNDTTIGIQSISVAGGNHTAVTPTQTTAGLEFQVNIDAQVVTKGDSATLFNKSVVPRTSSVATVSVLTADATLYDVIEVTALAGPLTVSAPTGTPKNNQRLLFSIKDNGGARALTWNAIFTDGSLPTATTVGQTTWVGAVYKTSDASWHVATNPPAAAGSVTATSADVFSNKDLKSAANTFANVTSIASNATLTPTGDSRQNEFYATAQAVNMTIAAPSGTATDHNKLMLQLTPTTTGLTLTFNSAYQFVGCSAPTVTTAGKEIFLFGIYKATTAKWQIVGVAQE